MSDKKPVDKNEKDTKGEAIRPDAETLHTTDPQKKMEGPISSLMHGAGKTFDTDETKKEADIEKDENM